MVVVVNVCLLINRHVVLIFFSCETIVVHLNSRSPDVAHNQLLNTKVAYTYPQAFHRR